ncbi:hypothetical protein SeLEV6574_g06969, partial [Synchytrium endobioticum]
EIEIRKIERHVAETHVRSFRINRDKNTVAVAYLASIQAMDDAPKTASAGFFRSLLHSRDKNGSKSDSNVTLDKSFSSTSSIPPPHTPYASLTAAQAQAQAQGSKGSPPTTESARTSSPTATSPFNTAGSTTGSRAPSTTAASLNSRAYLATQPGAARPPTLSLSMSPKYSPPANDILSSLSGPASSSPISPLQQHNGYWTPPSAEADDAAGTRSRADSVNAHSDHQSQQTNLFRGNSQRSRQGASPALSSTTVADPTRPSTARTSNTSTQSEGVSFARKATLTQQPEDVDEILGNLRAALSEQSSGNTSASASQQWTPIGSRSRSTSNPSSGTCATNNGKSPFAPKPPLKVESTSKSADPPRSPFAPKIDMPFPASALQPSLVDAGGRTRCLKPSRSKDSLMVATTEDDSASGSELLQDVVGIHHDNASDQTASDGSKPPESPAGRPAKPAHPHKLRVDTADADDATRLHSAESNGQLFAERHLIQVFPRSSSGVFNLDGWEPEVYEDTTYCLWRRALFETLCAQVDYPLLVPAALNALITDDFMADLP